MLPPVGTRLSCIVVGRKTVRLHYLEIAEEDARAKHVAEVLKILLARVKSADHQAAILPCSSCICVNSTI